MRNLLCFWGVMTEAKRYYVYIMASKSRVVYAGMTGNLMARVLQHKSGEEDGFFKRYYVSRLVYFESFQYVNNATLGRPRLRSGGARRK